MKTNSDIKKVKVLLLILIITTLVFTLLMIYYHSTGCVKLVNKYSVATIFLSLSGLVLYVKYRKELNSKD